MPEIHEDSINTIKNLIEKVSGLRYQLYSFKYSLIGQEAGKAFIDQIDEYSKHVLNETRKLEQCIEAMEIIKNSRLEENKLLREVNTKLLVRIKTLDDKDRLNEIKTNKEKENINQNEIINVKNLVSVETQTEINTSLIKTPKVINQKHSIFSTPKVKPNKTRKIIIYMLPHSTTENDILNSISNQLNEPVDKIKFCKQFVNYDKSKNFVFEMPSLSAIKFIQAPFSFCDSMFNVKYFINVLRCYNCQRLGHVAKSCKFSVCCAICSKTSHNSNNCSSNTQLCVNCVAHNVIFNTNFETNHSSYSKNCKTFKVFIHKRRQILEEHDSSFQSISCASPVLDNSIQQNLETSNFDDSGFAE